MTAADTDAARTFFDGMWLPSNQKAAKNGDGSVDPAVSALREGRFVVVVADGSGGGTGDGTGYLVLAAQATTPAKLAFMVRHTSGVVCVAIEGRHLDALQLPPMVADHVTTPGGPHPATFTVSVDAAVATATGASAASRCQTIHALVDPGTKPGDLRRPGHVFPLRAHDGGVLQRPGHGEAAVDLARLAGVRPAGVVAELVADDGTAPRRLDLERFATKNRCPLVTVADLVGYRQRRERLVRQVTSARLPTAHGDFTAVVFESLLDGVEHVALVRGEVGGAAEVLVHIHPQCLTGDTFGAHQCRCGRQLDAAMARTATAAAGVVVYLRGPDDVHGETGPDTGVGAQILVELGVRAVRLLADDPASRRGLEGYGLDVVDELPLLPDNLTENLTHLPG